MIPFELEMNLDCVDWNKAADIVNLDLSYHLEVILGCPQLIYSAGLITIQEATMWQENAEKKLVEANKDK